MKKHLARKIILAQIASDAGKEIHILHIPGDEKAHALGYKMKEHYILQAIEEIDRHPIGDANYWVTVADDQNGYESVIVYFDLKLHGERLQVSFHNHGCPKLWEIGQRGRRTRWCQRKPLDSREVCLCLVDEFFPDSL